MPSSLTHYIFGKTSQKEISNAFLVGTQGPDPFFYNGYTSINAKRAKTVRNFGKFLHSIDPYKTFEFISNYINEHKNDEETLKEYALGILNHYVLDRVTHPYIFYKTGFPLSEQKYSFAHSRFESILDVILGNRFNYQLDFVGILKLSDGEAKVISKMYFELSKNLGFEELEDNDFIDSLKTMRTAAKIINPKHHGLRTFAFDRFLRVHTIRAMSHPFLKEIDESIDYLNLNKVEWFSCIDNSSKGNSSFIDLLDEAKLSYLEAKKIFLDLLIDSTKKEELNSFINDINHDGFKEGSEFKFFDKDFSEKIQNNWVLQVFWEFLE